MNLTNKIIEEFDKKFDSVPALMNNKDIQCCHCGENLALESYELFSDGYEMAVDDCKSFLLFFLKQVATEAIGAVRLEKRKCDDGFDTGYMYAISQMEQKAKKFLDENF